MLKWFIPKLNELCAVDCVAAHGPKAEEEKEPEPPEPFEYSED